MEFLAFHLMPYAEPEVLEEISRQDALLKAQGRPEELSAWVTFSNSNYDPRKGAELYQRYIEQLVCASEVGFDGIGVNEHHQNSYGTICSPNVMAATLIPRLPKARKIAILGNALPLHDPLRIAEDVAMLDVLSGGRIISGFVRGIGHEHLSYDLNPNESRPRAEEAQDFILSAWTRPGPFAWHGKYYHHEYVNVWPRPLQQPHPPVWIPSAGSSETIDYAAERHFPYLQTYTPTPRLVEMFKQYRAACRGFGYEAERSQMGWAIPVYVGDSDEKAREELRPHFHNYFNRLLTGPVRRFFPPGYTTDKSHQQVVGTKGTLFSHNEHKLEDLEALGMIAVGTPDTVIERLRAIIDVTGCGICGPLVQMASMPHEMAMKSIQRFGQEVIPALKDHVPAVLKDEDAALAAVR